MGLIETIQSLESSVIIFFLLSIATVCVFEFINGFHDTANAVATVIYTKSLKPQVAVLLSGTLNFLGVITSIYFFGMSVAMGIIKLLPIGEMQELGLEENISIVAAVLLGAIIWNLGTWYFGIPCSSSHTLIGSLLGAGLGFQILHGGVGVNWDKAKDIGLSLLLSPAFGFSVAILLIFLLKRYFDKKQLFKENNEGTPPLGIRMVLIGTCSLVSFFHGSNDGQKGLGLLMIILMTFLPMKYALNESFGDENTMKHLENISIILEENKSNSPLEKEFTNTILMVNELKMDVKITQQATTQEVFNIRKRIQSIGKSLELITKDPELLPNKDARNALKSELIHLKSYTEFAPNWALIMVALSIGIGTMVGWKRIVVTIGEKIGKSHLSYGQGAVSELVAASTIGMSTYFGLPVSTTHVLSSGIAGSMVAVGGVKNLQKNTMKNIVIAWVLTLPVTILLSLGLYFLIRLFF